MNVVTEHSALIGITRGGKSETERTIVSPRMAGKNRDSVVVVDGAGPLARKMAIDCLYEGIPFLYDALRETDYTLGYPFFEPSTHPDELQREAEDRERVAEMNSALVGGEGKVDTTTTPIIDEGLTNLLFLLIHQKTRKPFYRLREALVPGTRDHRELVADCTNRSIVRQFNYYASLNARDWEYKCGPAHRRIQRICGCPQFRVRCTPTFDFDGILDAGIVLLIDGSSTGNLGRPDASMLMRCIILRLIQAKRSGRIARRVILVIDEGVASKLIDEHVVRALAEAAKWGLEIHLIIQDPMSIPEAAYPNIGRLFIFRQASGAAIRLAAELCAIPQLDPHKIHSIETRSRMEHTGRYDIEQVINTGQWVSGDQTGRSENVSHVARAVYREKVDEFKKYFTLEDQVKLFQKTIAKLGVGYCLIRSGQMVTPAPIYIPMKKVPWAGLRYSATQTLGEKKLELYMERVKRSIPVYRKAGTEPIQRISNSASGTAADRLHGGNATS